MIDKIKLKSGSAKGQPSLEFDVEPITIFVGPNNSGKSSLIREIELFIKHTDPTSRFNILDKITYPHFSEEEVSEELKRSIVDEKEVISNHEKQTIVNRTRYFQHDDSISFFRSHLIQEVSSKKYSHNFGQYLSLFLLKLDGANRLRSSFSGEGGNLERPNNIMAKLFIMDSSRALLRDKLFEAFGKYLVVDHITNYGNFTLKFAENDIPNVDIEKSLNAEAVKFMSNAATIQQFSDGVKAYTSILTFLLVGNPKIVLIDEPEAFLHPSLSHRLGKEIGKIINGSNKKFFASTHSSSFLMGCLQSGTPLNVVRLTFKDNVSTSRLLPKEKILTLMRNPLLRSTGVLSGLFYEAVVVTEGDSDRAFYQEINERLLSEGDSRGINNCLFLNAQNKQTVWDIVKPLRELGIPTIGVVDIDVIKDGGSVFSKLLSSTFIPESNHEALNLNRLTLKKNFEGIDLKKSGGVTQLDTSKKEGAENFFNQLDEYGCFAIRSGEVESWLSHLNVGRHGSKWLIEIFEKMGDDPSSSSYLKPQSGDVWDFIGSLKSWIDNQSRKGIPI